MAGIHLLVAARARIRGQVQPPDALVVALPASHGFFLTGNVGSWGPPPAPQAPARTPARSESRRPLLLLGVALAGDS